MSEQKQGERTGAAWGEQAEADERARREELLAKVPEEARESISRLLDACGKDVESWAYALTIASIVTMDFERSEHKDALKEVLQFFRLSVIRGNLKLWLEMIEDIEREKQPLGPVLTLLLVRSGQETDKMLMACAARVKLLLGVS